VLGSLTNVVSLFHKINVTKNQITPQQGGEIFGGKLFWYNNRLADCPNKPNTRKHLHAFNNLNAGYNINMVTFCVSASTDTIIIMSEVGIVALN
jgi:hypothetical protein